MIRGEWAGGEKGVAEGGGVEEMGFAASCEGVESKRTVSFGTKSYERL